MTLKLPLPLWATLILAISAGALLPLSLAPYNVWPCGILAPAILALCLHRGTGKQCLLAAFAFGLGLYGVGASWVYISIHQFGSTSIPLSLILTSAFVAGLAFAFALPFYLYGRLFSQTLPGMLLAFPAFWVLGEWMRSWFLTGFPWLYLGYGHLQTPLAGFAPILGVFGVSLCVTLTASLAATLIAYRSHWRSKVVHTVAFACSAIWVSGAGLRYIDWTTLDEDPVTLGMAQGNIPQERKWDPTYREETFRIFGTLSEPLWQYDWVIWPEAAIPLMYHQALKPLKRLGEIANATNTVFITGILYDQPDDYKFYNSIIALGKGTGITYKLRLVPFGEYVPLDKYLRGTIEFFNLPTSNIQPGPAYTNGLQTPHGEIAPSICYEVVYPDLVAKRALTAQFLLTISNDAWFGHSIGPIQHFQMAQMRALETGRYMIRSTNNGISGIIDPKGNALAQGDRFTREVLTGTVHAARGRTPFMLFGSRPTVLFCLLLLWVMYRRQSSWGVLPQVPDREARVNQI